MITGSCTMIHVHDNVTVDDYGDDYHGLIGRVVSVDTDKDDATTYRVFFEEIIRFRSYEWGNLILLQPI